MLTKPLSHLRPLLRLPTHTQPDHFTPNPNLLHHLPQNGGVGGHGLVSSSGPGASAASGSAGSASAGAGKAGWGAGAGGSGSGGYTGHARAFLSLAQSSAVDPSSSIVISDDNAPSNSSRAPSLLLKHRISRSPRLVELESSPANIRRAIQARGGSRLAVVDIESEVSEESSARLLESEGEHTRRRSSIAFPSPAALASASSSRADTVTPRQVTSRSSTPSRRPLSRSSSSVDVWQVGIPQPRGPQLAVRPLSTRASPSPLPSTEDDAIPSVSVSVSPAPSRSARTIPQPNRVLMDLAGMDVPLSRRRFGRSIRHNSSVPELRLASDDIMLDATAEQPTTDKADLKIFETLIGAKQWNQKALVRQIVAHYRSPRVVGPFDSTGITGDPELSPRLPLPAGYTVNTYNACLDALIHTRSSGESIALILEIYNEMLERDILPNGRTYTHVIRALCVREKDVWTAASRWAAEMRFGRWRSEQISSKWDRVIETEKDGLVDGYIAEGNFASALKLFRATMLLKPAQWKFSPAVYGSMLDAACRQTEPDIKTMIDVMRHAQVRAVSGTRGLYHRLFTAFGKVGDKEGLKAMWDEFEQVRANGGGVDLMEWTDEASAARRVVEGDEAKSVEHLQRVAWESAIGAFISVGEVEKATQLFQSMLDSVGREEIDLLAPPAANASTMGQFAVHLAKSGQLDLAEEWHDRLATSSELNRTHYQRFLASDLHALSDELVYAGRWRKAVSILGPQFWAKASGGVPLSIDKDVARRVYTAIVAFAISASDSEALEVLPLLRQIADYSKIITDPFLLTKHVELCERLGRFDQISHVLDGFMPFSTPSSLPGLHTLAARVIPQMNLSEVGQLLRAFARQRQQLSPAIAAVAAEVYVKARAEVPAAKDLELGPDGWFRLADCFARIRGPQLQEGEWDEAIERYLSDVAELRSDKGDVLADFDTPPATFNALVKNVLDRFGSDRARILLKPFGEQNVERAITRVFALERDSAEVSSPESSEFAADSASASASATDMTSQSDVFSIPPTSASESSMTPPYSPQPPSQHTLHVDYTLSANVDKHTARNPPLTPLQAYHQVRKALTSSNAVPHIDALSRLISSLGRIGEEAKVEELYNLSQVILSSTIAQNHQASAWRNVEDAMLNASCFLGHLEQAGAHRARIVQAGMAPSADAYATMIASSKDTTDDALVARELFDESQALGVRPNLYLYNTIISKLSKARKAEVALELFGHMKGAGIRPSSVTYGAVINACCRVGDSESAETLFAEMASQPNFKPRVPPFNTMMQFYLQTVPSRERVLHYFSLLRSSGVTPSAHTYKLLLDAYSTLQPTDLVSMERVFAELVSDPSVRVQGTHWASLITAYGIYGGDLPKALEVFNGISTHPTSSGPIESVAWEAMLNVLAHRGTLSQLDEMRTRMIDSKTKATAYVFNVLIGGYSRLGAIDRAREIFESMGDSIVGVAAPNNHPALKTSSGHVKPSTVTEGPSDVVYREPSTYEAIIRAEISHGDRTRAEEALRKMEARGYPVAVFMRARAVLDEQPIPDVMKGFTPVMTWNRRVGQEQAQAEPATPAEPPAQSQAPAQGGAGVEESEPRA